MTAKKNKPEDATEETSEVEPQSETGEPLKVDKITAIRPEGLHERLEDAELAGIGTNHEYSQALNRVTILTGTLKNALPGAIEHIEDEDLRSGLQALFDLL